jgi:hypothetical protein
METGNALKGFCKTRYSNKRTLFNQLDETTLRGGFSLLDE